MCGTLHRRGEPILRAGGGGPGGVRDGRARGRAASIRVPLDRDHPGLGRLTVGYAVVRHTARSQPPLEPIVAFEGGPGFEGTRLVSDVAVSGRAVWDRRAWLVHARLRLSGAATGVLGVSFRTDAAGAIATISGRIGARTVHLQTPAPWAPQG